MLSTEIRYFLAVADCGSLTAASQQLFVATSAISRQIQRLEQDTGVTLFERHARGMVLTDAGRMFEHRIRQSMREMDSTLSEIKGLTAIRRTAIRIVCTDGLAWHLLPALCSQFRQQYPSVSFHLQVGNTRQVAESLHRGECDLALQFCLHAERGVQVAGSWPAPILVVMSASHPLAGKAFQLQDLSSYPVALPDQSTTVRQLFDLSCQMNGVFIEPTITCNNFGSLYHFLTLNPLTVTLCSRYSLLYHPAGHPLAVRSLAINALTQRTLQIHLLPGRQQSAALKLFLGFITDQLQQQHEQFSADSDVTGG
ncbi:LysR family transcriptional regulator [Tatumella morbirosei]|uniref:LysR family transcriptional regulator n=1 Tax=Tatumella morbirosei TaxID=642227 RepID=A0A095TJF5_9GAMM|nr:LysR family transcriptional regulator [Tatumella morbirosei]KGD76664.1 LysR family transcriptional regulator [Tatumella morbirosei]